VCVRGCVVCVCGFLCVCRVCVGGCVCGLFECVRVFGVCVVCVYVFLCVNVCV